MDTPTKAAWPSLKEEYICSGAIKQIVPNQATHVVRAFLSEEGIEDSGHEVLAGRRPPHRVNQHLKYFGFMVQKLGGTLVTCYKATTGWWGSI